MQSISLVTVTYNNAGGLRKTLQSIADLKKRPQEVIVIDGGSTDSTSIVISEYENVYPIIFVSEKDNGIYDAMNKGKKLAKYDFIHYLNAGDYVQGEPYDALELQYRYLVKILDENGAFLSFDKIKIYGFGYCHQGILFFKEHPPYDLHYKIAADFDLIMQVFPFGLKELPVINNGYVVYGLGGVSSKKRMARDIEILEILYKRCGCIRALGFIAYSLSKLFIPKTLRRRLLKIK